MFGKKKKGDRSPRRTNSNISHSLSSSFRGGGGEAMHDAVQFSMRQNPRDSHSSHHNVNNSNNPHIWSLRTDAATSPVLSHVPTPSVWQRLQNVQERRKLVLSILNSTVWRSLLLIFAVLLLFGQQFRELVLPKQADGTVDILFLLVFGFLVIDIVLRCDTERHYFFCYQYSNWNFGSFLFWCDMVSTLTLLYDISFINSLNFREKSIQLSLENGFPTSGLDSVNRALPVELDFTLFVVIFQTFRVARFIRSSRAVKISGKINWYFFLNIMSPSWWYRTIQAKLPQTKQSRTKKSQDPSNLDQRSQLLEARKIRRNTFGGVTRGLQTQESLPNRSFFSKLRLQLRSPFETEEFRQHVAATKIQRAWRHAHGHGTEYATANSNRAPDDAATEQDEDERRRNESQVGSAMRELTGQRVAIGIIVSLVFTLMFTYVEEDATRPSSMIVLHNQTANEAFANRSLEAARKTAIPDLFQYEFGNRTVVYFDDVIEGGVAPDDLRSRERLNITIQDSSTGYSTIGLFSYRDERRQEAFVSLFSTLFILLVWFFGVTAFAGPVMVLVVIPIERMVQLLGMLMVDPLGYQSTTKYKRFVDEENEITKNTRWTKEILKGMETSFLMSTILRIGSLMKVGFGSAGVEIIRNNLQLEKGRKQNTLILSSKGSTVSCIFLFCDIRNFTDATECLQEEVFVFTNRIAAVVHSFCHAYGGSANKNVGDAFLLSWQLEEESTGAASNHDSFSSHHMLGTIGDGFVAKNHQADKALLSVVKICMALHHDDYYIEAMTDGARQALVTKLKNRKGPVVQMGFGLHAGRAVQGAIGSQRKIDATYVSEAVERAEFLESQTKKYGLKVLMSDSFHRLLHFSIQRRCRKVDQIMIMEEEDDDDEDDYIDRETMELFTFDMDIDALWTDNKKSLKMDNGRDSDTASESGGSKRGNMAKLPSAKLPRGKRLSKRITLTGIRDESEEMSPSSFLAGGGGGLPDTEAEGVSPTKLLLPNGPALYNANVWTSEDMRTVRQLYSDGLFFQKFSSGLQSFYAKDWDHAKQCFTVILERFEDGPSKYFMKQIEEHDGKPPRDFLGYGQA